jgi:hypothetical protein
MQVDVYRNLNSNSGLYSVKNMEYGTDGYGCVVDDSPVNVITVTDVEFIVHESGQKRVREEGRKNAHAFVRGQWVDESVLTTATVDTEPVTYDPYVFDSFVHAHTEEPVTAADAVKLDENGVHAVL